MGELTRLCELTRLADAVDARNVDYWVSRTFPMSNKIFGPVVIS